MFNPFRKLLRSKSFTGRKGLACTARRPARAKLELQDLEVRVALSPLSPPYSPFDLRQAYGFNNIGFLNGNYNRAGAGQTIAIVVAGDDARIGNDLHQFDQFWRLPDAPSFTVARPQGYPGPALGAWGLETSLDVEWAHAMAPSANILLVEGYTNFYAAAAWAAQQPGVCVVSMSWGYNEYQGEQGNDGYFVTPSGHSGVTFVAASGDQGVPIYPSTSPNVLSIGGTVLSIDSSGSHTETAWSGTGRGISPYEGEPGYQRGAQSTGRRTSPDVAYNAGASVWVYDSYDNATNPWQGVIGTSAGAPQWSALIAIADQARAMGSLAALDGSSQILPLLYHPASVSAFTHITSGSYDTVTGLGTPNAPRIVDTLSQRILVAGSKQYMLRQSTVWQYDPSSGWQQISGSGDVLGFGVASDGRVYAYSHQTVYQYRGPSGNNWDQVSGSGDVVGFGVASDGRVYAYSHQTVYQYRGPTGNNWDQVSGGADVLGFAVAADGHVYASSHQAVYQYRGPSGNNWDQVSGYDLSDLVAADAGLFAYRFTDHSVVRYSGSGQVWNQVSGHDLSELVAGVGGLFAYRFTDHSVVQYSGSGQVWNQVSSNDVQTLVSAPGGQLYMLNFGHQVTQYTGDGHNWTPISSADVQTLVTAPNGQLYMLNFGHQVTQYTGDGHNWTPISSADVQTLVIAPNGQLYMLNFGHQVTQYTGSGIVWTPISSADVQTLVIAPSGQLYMLNFGHQVTQYTGDGHNWTPIFNSAQALAMGPDGVLYVLTDAYGMFECVNGTWLTTSTAAVTPDGTLYQVAGNQVQQYTTAGWVTISAAEVGSLAVGDDGGLYALTTYNQVNRYTGDGWDWYGISTSDVAALVAAGDGTLYILHAGGGLDIWDPATASGGQVDAHVIAIAAAIDGRLFALHDDSLSGELDYYVNGVAYYYDSYYASLYTDAQGNVWATDYWGQQYLLG